MTWYSIRFDGEGLAFARITRHDRHGVAYMTTGAPIPGPEGNEYPTLTRLVGFQRVPHEQIIETLATQYGNATRVGEDVVGVRMSATRIWAESIVHLRAFEQMFSAPLLKIQEGHATMYVESKSDLSDAAILGRLEGAAPTADVQRLDDFDTSPWDGLTPSLSA